MSALDLGAAIGIAHLVTTGLGPFYDGILHFLQTPQDFLPVLALALLGGLRGAPYGRSVLFLLPAAWLAGGIAGLVWHLPVGSIVATISVLLCGLLVAADTRLPRPACAALAAVIGLVHGLENGGTITPMRVGLLELLGIGTAIFTVSALASALVVSLRPPWTRIAVRVAGSWVAAIGLLLLGWFLRHPS